MQDKSNNSIPPAQPTPADQANKPSSRRSRKDEEGRDFQCGCGKRYLSYPALYTHIKTKHDGKQPEGTLKSGTPHVTKRAKSKLDEDSAKPIRVHFKPQQARVLQYLPEAAGSVPLNSRIKRQTVPKEVYDCFLSFTKDKEMLHLRAASSLELALLVFLVNVGDYVNEKVYEHYLHFARLARSAFADHGDEIYNCLFAPKHSPFPLPDFNSTQVAYFPAVADFIVTDCISRLLPPQEGRQVNASLIELITFEFCSWLFEQRLTQMKVSLMDDFKLDYQVAAVTGGSRKGSPSKAEPEKEEEEGKMGEEGSEELSDNPLDVLDEDRPIEDELDL